MRISTVLLLALSLASLALTSCQSISGPIGGVRDDAVNDASLYRSQDRTFRGPSY